MLLEPTVSVVIPSHDRPDQVLVAARSALSQTLTNIEVAVVLDGASSETRSALATLGDSRLRIFEFESPRGANAARNLGVREARARWIAFLDDDDEWYPEKLEKQLQAAQEDTGGALPIVVCRLVARLPNASHSLPRRLPNRGEHFSEYLFCRNDLFRDEGAFQSSMLLAPAELLQRVPFRDSLSRHQDWDWILRAVAEPDVRLVFMEQTLGVWDARAAGGRLSASRDWTRSLTWIREVRALVTPSAFAGFLLTQAAHRAALEHAWSAFFSIPWVAMTEGRLRIRDLAVFLGFWLVPGVVRESILKRRLLLRR